jgi:hypothetical protein
MSSQNRGAGSNGSEFSLWEEGFFYSQVATNPFLLRKILMALFLVALSDLAAQIPDLNLSWCPKPFGAVLPPPPHCRDRVQETGACSTAEDSMLLLLSRQVQRYRSPFIWCFSFATKYLKV